ncbi:chromosomal replication initiator DnaA [Siccirubricoccus sp. KC 17139]|uniref:Chromosomal replication initiator DnaA n=1 Tax=Siccirubricoccus soli TaxID=2899147 RepID=A0ABT1DDC1_9PROT|nr:chromosomal replication initiator DnaA [Siccirubricoccus soli]MCO6419938.1 chromosomal replication initiator DnaA [Siccirubricoccus soli]MCP2686073.1 chromosomal replication initiator DnaA [Siccirubricoccus soli]
MTATARQLALPLRLPPPSPGALLEDSSNAEALAWLARPGAWPLHRLALHGPAATGKSHMLAEFAARHAWPALDGPALRGLPEVPEGPGLAVDDADCAADEAALFHLLNICAERRQAVLLAGRAPPARWPVALPDLASRLRAITAVGVQPPSDALLAALLRKHFAARQLRVDPGVQEWLLLRLPREAAAMAEAAARLDKAALAAGGAVTRPLARAALGDWLGLDPAPTDDVSMAMEEAASPPTPRLL